MSQKTNALFISLSFNWIKDMALLDPNWKPSNLQLRQFGLLCALVLPVVCWWWSLSVLAILISFLLGVTISILGLVAPQTLKPLFVGLMIIAMPIGLVVSELSLLLVYALVFFPIGICFLILRRDRLMLKLERQSSSYWERKSKAKSIRNYYRQF